MTDIVQTSSFAETPKDGNWYQLPEFNADFTELIRWDNELLLWNWMMLKDRIVVVDSNFIVDSEFFA